MRHAYWRRWDQDIRRSRRYDEEVRCLRREDDGEQERRLREDEEDLRRRDHDEEQERRRNIPWHGEGTEEPRGDSHRRPAGETSPRRAPTTPFRRRSAPIPWGTWMLGLSVRQLILVWLLFLAILLVAGARHVG